MIARTFSATLYPRAALETAVLAFQGICSVRLVDDGTEAVRATFELPSAATEDVVAEFCNVALVASIEAQLGPGHE